MGNLVKSFSNRDAIGYNTGYMSGHSHYATIKRQKAANDAVKGNLFSKLARNIMIAAKGGADPDLNFKLRVEIDKARAASMPKENIERAIMRATTEAANLSEVAYEGFGPGGIGIIVEAATDNRNRTAQEIKNTFDRAGGSLGGPGAVSFNFERKGFILVPFKNSPDEEELALIDAGAEDIQKIDEGFEVYTDPDKLSQVHKKLLEMGFETKEIELVMRPKTLVEINASDSEKAQNLLEALEELDEVQKVFTNADFA